MERPTGVTILGVLSVLGGVMAFAIAFVFLFGAGFLARFTGMPNFIASVAATAAAAGITIGLIDFVVAYGFFTLANWARILAIVCVALSLVGTVFRTLRDLFRFHFLLFPLPRQIVFIVVDILILWYLSRPHVKRAFSAASRAAEPPGASSTPAASA